MSIVSYEGRGGEIMENESSIEVSTPNASYALVKATIDSQIATARAFPRNLRRAVDEVKTMAGLTKEIAKSCIYALPRGGKTIEGPSARFAEILASCWGNISVQGRVIDEDDKVVVVMGECIDLQRNNRVAVELRVGIIDKYGKKYNADMINMTANAAISKATRNAIFKVVPRAFWDGAYEQVRQVIKGSLKAIDVERGEWLDFWRGKAIPAEHVYQALGVNGREEITEEHVITMIGWNQSIENGEAQLYDIFPVQVVVSVKAQNLNATLADVKAKQAAANQVKQPVKPLVQEEFPDEPGSRG
ncbi:MAG: hypothetical protein P4L67_04715 [Candidatus Pacebacteria bacterium]|nr:hypothetical protein [Candidatus Paceibacterota bacterium]